MVTRSEMARLAARIKRLKIVSPKLVDSLLSGNYRSVFRGPGIEFDEVRSYVDGDDARLIDWNVSSRLGSAYLKTFKEERELTVFLIADVSASLEVGAGEINKKDVATLVIALITYAAAHNNDKVGGLFFSDEIESWIPPAKGRNHANRVIQTSVVRKSAGRGSDLALALRVTLDTMKRRGICIVISDFKTGGYWRDLALLARRHDVIAVRIDDPLDREFPRVGLVHVEDPESGRSIPAFGASRRFRRRYREYWEGTRRQWRHDCRRAGVATIEIDTTDDPAMRLIQFFRARGRR